MRFGNTKSEKACIGEPAPGTAHCCGGIKLRLPHGMTAGFCRTDTAETFAQHDLLFGEIEIHILLVPIPKHATETCSPPFRQAHPGAV